MVSPVFSLTTNASDPVYNDENIRHVIEDQLPMLKRDEGTTTITVEDHLRHRFEHDFYNLLSELNVPRSAYYATLRLNGYTHPQQYTVDHETLRVPSETAIQRLHRLHKTYNAYNR